MTIAELITYTRNQSGASSGNFTDAEILVYLNIAYHDIENKIVSELNEDYFWDIFTADTVASQNEYTLQATNATTEGIKKINRVEIKWDDADTYHTLTTSNTLDNWKESDAYMQASVPSDRGWFEFREGSIFLYPTPSESVTDGLKIHAIKSMIDLVSGGAETTIFPNHTELRQYHHVIGMGAVPHILRERKTVGEQAYQNAQVLYNEAVTTMLSGIGNKVASPIEGILPNSKYYSE